MNKIYLDKQSHSVNQEILSRSLQVHYSYLVILFQMQQMLLYDVCYIITKCVA
jgi:hypothetical protein